MTHELQPARGLSPDRSYVAGAKTLIADGHVSPGFRVANFNLFAGGIVGELFVVIFDLWHLKYSDEYSPQYPSNK